MVFRFGVSGLSLRRGKRGAQLRFLLLGKIRGDDLELDAFHRAGDPVHDRSAFERALGETSVSGKPALIELRIDPQAITTTTTLDAIRGRALKG